MKTYPITEEQIDEIIKAKHPKRVLMEMFPKKEIKPLEVGKWYVGLFAENVLSYFHSIDKNKNIKGYGVEFRKNWYNDLLETSHFGGIYDINDWKPATDEQVKTMLTNQLIERYGEDWENCEIKECLILKTKPNFPDWMPYFTLNNTVIWNKNGCVFKDGVWAEKL